MRSTVVRFNAKTQRHFQECPAWCMGHTDDNNGRRHVGMRAAIEGNSARTGAPLDMYISAELHDDGFGTCREVFLFKVADQAIELRASSMHFLINKAGWNIFWKLNSDGSIPIRTPEPAAAPVFQPQATQNRGGRA